MFIFILFFTLLPVTKVFSVPAPKSAPSIFWVVCHCQRIGFEYLIPKRNRVHQMDGKRFLERSANIPYPYLAPWELDGLDKVLEQVLKDLLEKEPAPQNENNHK